MRRWSVLRLGGQFWHHAWSRKPAECPAGCSCIAVTERACEIQPPRWGGEYCIVKDTVAFAVHQRAYGAFASTRQRALHALQRGVSQCAPACTMANVLNGTMGLPSEAFHSAWGDLPWFDMWLPATQPTIHVVPSIAVQQIKQGDITSSVKFKQQCFTRTHPPNPDAL